MFGKKNKKIEPEIDVNVETIPTDFYGGVNPLVKFKTVEKEVDLNKETRITESEKKSFDKATVVGSSSKLHIANLLTSPKFLFLSAGVLFVIFSVIAGIYYWKEISGGVIEEKTSIQEVVNTNQEPASIESQPIEQSPIENEEEVVEEEGEKVVNILDLPPIYPSITLGRSIDSDNDGVTDVAEELFLTDPGMPDTDGDKYLDGHEIYNLYNPTGKEPLKLSDSGLVEDFVNPVFGYKVYYPKNWALGNVDENYRSVLFSTITGEYVEVRSVEKQFLGEDFSSWFSHFAPNERFDSLKDFETVFKDKGKQRSDGLVYYFETPRRVYIFIYGVTNNTEVNYEIVIKMMARSFRLPLTEEILPLPIIENSGTTDSDLLNEPGELIDQI